MNELLFFAHIFLMVCFLFVALKKGKMALTALIALQAVFANLFVVKQMLFFGFEVTCSDVYAIGSLFTLNVLQEFYGREAAKRAVGISLIACFFFAVMSQMHVSYLPSAFDQTHTAFAQIFSSTPRIVFASMAVYWIVQQFDVRFFGWLQKRVGAFPLRVAISLVISQTLDTVLFSFVGLYGIVSSLFDIIVISLLTKWLAILCNIPFTTLFKKVSVPTNE